VKNNLSGCHPSTERFIKMSKFLYVVCDKDGNPFTVPYSRTWAFENKKDAFESCNPGDYVVKYKACKLREE